jgi:hypothetical protein
LFDDCVEAGLVDKDVAKFVEAYTTPATSEAISGGCKGCPICTEDFSDAGGDGDNEPAVKTKCVHFFGKPCLQVWVDSWDREGKAAVPNCPNCRAKLYDQIDMPPETLQVIMREYVAYARSDVELDREVDAFLLAARVEDVHGRFDPSLGVMLEKLDQRRTRMFQYGRDIQLPFKKLIQVDVQHRHRSSSHSTSSPSSSGSE